MNAAAHRVFFKGKTISGFHFDRQGNLWLSTLNEGVFLVSHLESLWYENTSSIPGIPVTAIFQHQKKLYWGNDRGEIGTIENDSVRCMNMLPAIRPFGRGRVREFRVNPDQPDEIWAVTENGLLIFRNGILYGNFPSPSKTIEFHDGQVYVGNARNCLVEKAEVLRQAGEQILSDSRRKQLDRLAIIERHRAVWKKMRHILPQNRVYKIARDAGGMIWMACQTGVYSLQYDKIFYQVENHPDFGLSFQNLACLGNGSIAFGSNGRGIMLLDPSGKTRWFGAAQGLSSAYIRNLRPQGKDSLWICTDEGISLLKAGSDAAFSIDNWTKNNCTLISGDVWDVGISKDSLWLACAAGIQCIPSLSLLRVIKPSLPEIESVSVNGVLQMPQDQIPNAGLGDAICIRFRNPDYRSAGKILIQYRLLPDTHWKDLAGNTIRERALVAGVFRLELRLLNPKAEVLTAGNVLQIQAGSSFERFSERSRLDAKSLILLFIPVVLLLTAYFFYFFKPGFFKHPGLQTFTHGQLDEMHMLLVSRSDFQAGGGKLLLSLRKQLSECGDVFSPDQELDLCRSYFHILSFCDPGARFQLDIREGWTSPYGLNAHFILGFLLHHLKPFETGGKMHTLSIDSNPSGWRLVLSRQAVDAPEGESEEIEEFFPHSRDLPSSLILLPLKRLFPKLILHRKPPLPPV
jgi:hypothetical protein